MTHVRSQRSPSATRSSLFPYPHHRRSSPNRQQSSKVPNAAVPARECERSQRLARSFVGAKAPTPLFSFASPLFEKRAKYNPCIFNHSRALHSLLCKSSSINPIVFIRPRTLWKNHPGGGGGHLLQFFSELELRPQQNEHLRKIRR